MKKGLLFLVGFVSFCSSGLAQNTPWSRRVQGGLTPSVQSRLLSAVTPMPRSTYTEQGLKDSFRNSDKYQNSISGFIGIVFQRERNVAFAVNVGYQQWGFVRRKENGMFNYLPHPDLTVYAHLVDGPVQVMDYHFTQRYLTVDLQYLRRLDGVKLRIPDTELYGFVSAIPAVLVQDKVRIKTRGFSLDEGASVDVYDYTVELDAVDRPIIQKTVNPQFNVFASFGLRAEYALDDKIKLLAQPRMDMALIPNFNGVQRANSYRFSLDLGVVYPIP